jgi:cysteine synthase A
MSNVLQKDSTQSNSSGDYTTKGRGKVYENIIDTIGDTPLVKINKVSKDKNTVADIYAKLEFFNPLSSIKDRLALSMINEAEAQGKINENTELVEPTSGNTGIALAFIAAAKGYKLTLTMPESMSMERRNMLKILGAKLELTEAAKGMKGAIERAREIVAENPNALLLQQFENPANPKIHRNTTAHEIWNDTNGEVDIFIAGVGTGGTLTGTAEVLKEKNKDIKIIAVEPEDSPVLSGGQPGPHKIQGIGAGFVPQILQKDLIDEVITIGNETSFEVAREVTRREGIPCGISSGATMAAALEVASRQENKGKKIVVIIASSAERYISTALFDF